MRRPGQPGPSRSPRAAAGFTLIELVMVMAIISALAVVALPNLLDLSLWRARAFADELQAELQAKQRLALAQRRPVTASIATTGVTFSYVAGGALGSVNCPATLGACISAASVGTITFNASNAGRATTSTGSTLALTVQAGSYSQAFALEPETGLIRRLP